MTDETIFDVIIVGAGMAGMVAANRAAELGLKPLVLEKGSEERYPCNTRWSGGALHICMQDIEGSPPKLLEAIQKATSGTASPELAEALVSEAPLTYEWLKSAGIQFVRVPAITQNHVLSPAKPNMAGQNWQGRGGDVFLRTLDTRLIALGGRILRGAKAIELIMERGICVGLSVLIDGKLQELRSRAVVMADGGYQNDKKLLQQHISPNPDRVMQRNTKSGTGDGARMASKVGADIVGMDGGFYGHVLCRDVFDNEKLWPFPVLDFIAEAGIVVDATGRRFADEGQGGVYLANQIAKLPDPLSSVLIFDHAIWEGPGRHRAIPPNPFLVLAGGSVYCNSTITGLAEELGLPIAATAKTISEYNRAILSDQVNNMRPFRSVKTFKPHVIQQGPFYAVRLCAGITYTLGGIRTDESGRVLRKDASPIKGLFAAGATTGGLEGGEKNGYVGGLMKSAVFGKRVAEVIANSSGHLQSCEHT